MNTPFFTLTWNLIGAMLGTMYFVVRVDGIRAACRTGGHINAGLLELFDSGCLAGVADHPHLNLRFKNLPVCRARRIRASVYIRFCRRYIFLFIAAKHIAGKDHNDNKRHQYRNEKESFIMLTSRSHFSSHFNECFFNNHNPDEEKAQGILQILTRKNQDTPLLNSA